MEYIFILNLKFDFMTTFICITNEILMMLRGEKKYSREVSLFEPIGVDKDGETVSLVDVIELDDRAVPDTVILKQEISQLYQVFEGSLRDKEKVVIGMRYGLFGGKEFTQREIAAKLGISRSYVSDPYYCKCMPAYFETIC